MFYIRGREGRRGVFRRLCVGMILGCDFYWFGVGRGCDVCLWGGRVRKGISWGRVDVLVFLRLRCRRCACVERYVIGVFRKSVHHDGHLCMSARVCVYITCDY